MYTLPLYPPSDARYPFLVEEICLLVLTSALVVLFSLQWYVEQFQDEAVTSMNVKAQNHKLGLLASVMGLVQQLDSWGFQGWYPQAVPAFLTAEISCVLLTCLILMLRAVIVALFRTSLKQAPRWVDVLTYFFIISLFLVATLCMSLGLGLNQYWIVSIWLLWVALVIIVLNLTFTGTVIALMVLMKRLEKDAGVKKWKDRLWKRITLLIEAIVFLGLAAAVCPSQITSAIARIQSMKPGEGSIDFSRGYDPTSRIMTYITWLFAIFVLWVSWMPLRFSNAKREAFRTQPSDHKRASMMSKNTGSTTSGSASGAAARKKSNTATNSKEHASIIEEEDSRREPSTGETDNETTGLLQRGRQISDSTTSDSAVLQRNTRSNREASIDINESALR